MTLKRDKVTELMEEYFFGNCTQFAIEIGVDPSHLHRYIAQGIGGGKKLIGAIMKFCNEKKLDFSNYIEL